MPILEPFEQPDSTKETANTDVVAEEILTEDGYLAEEGYLVEDADSKSANPDVNPPA